MVPLVGTGKEGYEDGPDVKASLAKPMRVAVDDDGNIIIADQGNNAIRRWDAKTQLVSTVAGGKQGDTDGETNHWTQFSAVKAVAVDGLSGDIIIADDDDVKSTGYTDQNSSILRWSAATGVVTTLAGGSRRGYKDGKGSAALFGCVYDVAMDAAGNVIIADTGNHCIRRYDPATGMVCTLAGQGPRWRPKKPARSAKGLQKRAGGTKSKDTADDGVKPIELELDDGKGYKDGNATEARFSSPWAVAVDGSGNVIIADSDNHRIRRWDAKTRLVSTLAGSGQQGCKDGSALEASFNCPQGVAVDDTGNVYIADTYNGSVRRWDAATREVSTLRKGFFKYPRGVATHPSGELVVVEQGKNSVWCI